MSTKTLSFLLLAAFAAAQLPDSDRAASSQKNRQIQVGQPMELTAAQSAAVAVPLTLVAGDYRGPYDPADPQGVAAAARRRSRITGQARMQELRSYIPSDAARFMQKELTKLVLDESKRFALSHPKETAEIVSIVNKASNLYGTTTHKLRNIEKKQSRN